MRAPPPPPDVGTLIGLVRMARTVLDAMPPDRPIPPEVERARSCFYQLTDYHHLTAEDPCDSPSER